jgi:2-dehydropantoate 2-reductase
MRVAVVGAGAIGGYVGGMLARAGTETHLIARGAHLDAIRSDGLRIVADDGEFTVRPHATQDPHEVGPVDIVFLGLKAHQYGRAGPLLAPLLADGAPIVAAQNGVPWWYFYGDGGRLDGRRIESVDPGGTVSEAIAPQRAVGCVVYCSAEIAAPGVIRHVEGDVLALGEPSAGGDGRCGPFAAALADAGMRPRVVDDIRAQVWLKLMGNAVFNPLSVLTGATLGEICRNPSTRALAAALMEEVVAVSLALGRTPPVSIERRLAGAERVGDHKTSMLQDLEAGKKLELEPLTSAVIELAGLAGIDVPRLQTLHAATDLMARKHGVR